MDELFLLKYAATYEDVFNECGTNLYQLEKHYYTKGLPNNRFPKFDPLLWAASEASRIFGMKSCKMVYKNSNTPRCVVVEDLAIVKENMTDSATYVNITRLALKIGTLNMNGFESQVYYNVHHEQIDHFMTYIDGDKDLTEVDKANLFYICYGYWNKIELDKIRSLLYVASYPELIKNIGVNEDGAAYHFFNSCQKITFNPFMYVASNYLKSDSLKECVNCRGIIDPLRAAKHYIRHGINEKLVVNEFDCWQYLANNFKRIKKILKKMPNKKIDYDVIALTQEVICQDYIIRLKKKKKIQNDAFSATKFVKEYIDDEVVNKRKQLNLTNAAEYFVKYYVIYEKLRNNTTLYHRISLFCKGRVEDSMRQIPFNAARYIVETKCI